MASARSLAVTFFLGTFLWLRCDAQQSLRLASIYRSDMVLQMEPKSAHIWGYGEKLSDITVTLSSEQYTTVTDSDGKWSIRVPPQPAGGPHVLSVTQVSSGGDSEMLELTGVMFGDVWVCGGEDNMMLQMTEIFDAEEEMLLAESYQSLRLMQLAFRAAEEEYDDAFVARGWSRPTNATVLNFSALCLLYGEKLAERLGDRPIGLIDVSWEDTPIETWSSVRVTDECNTPPTTGQVTKKSNNAMWNGMIFPLTKLAVRGVAWCQGETNHDYNLELYPCHFKNLIQDWSNAFVDGQVAVPEERDMAFPFAFVQAGPASGHDHEAWGRLRWHQTLDLGIVPNPEMSEAYMALSYDLADWALVSGEMIPRDKLTVAMRLADATKHFLYGDNISTNGPLVESMELRSDTGLIKIRYRDATKSFGSEGFAYQMSNGQWTSAPLNSWTSREISVRVDPGAKQLSYGWTAAVCDYKECAVYDQNSDLPAQPWIWTLNWP